MRPHQRLNTKLRLQKISQTSSPSKQQQSPIQTSSIKSRINPSNLTTSYLKFKRFQQQKQKKQFYLQQSIKANCQGNNHHNNSNENELHQLNKKTQTIEEKNTKISDLQQKIVKKKMQLTILEQCFQRRTQFSKKDNFQSLFNQSLSYIMKFCYRDKQSKQKYLNFILSYHKQRKQSPQKSFKLLVEWVIKIIKQIFLTISKILKLPIQNNK